MVGLDVSSCWAPAGREQVQGGESVKHQATDNQLMARGCGWPCVFLVHARIMLVALQSCWLHTQHPRHAWSQCEASIAALQ